MKKVTKFGALLLGLVLAGGALVSCGGKESTTPSTNTSPTTSTSTVDATAVAKGAAEYLWDTYFKTDVQTKTDDFQLVKKAVYDGNSVSVSWTLTVTAGTAAAIYLDNEKSNENFQVVHVGYYQEEVLEETTYTLKPTVTFNGVTVELTDVVDAEKAFFSYKTPAFVLSDRAAWDLYDKAKVYNIKGVVLDVLQNGSSKGSFYFQDSEGYGYYAYKPSGAEAVKAGDTVVVTGKRSDYSGQQEFASGCTVHIYEDEERTATRLDATTDFASAASNMSFDAKYQNNLVKLEGCVPQPHEAIPDKDGNDTNSYYYFTVGNGKAQYNVYDSYYFLTDAQRAAFKTAWADAVANAKTINIYGISTVYSSQIQLYPSTAYPEVFEIAGDMSDAQKVDATLNEIAKTVKESYTEAVEVDLPAAGVRFTDAAIAWELISPTENANVVIEEGKLKIKAIDGSFEQVQVKATVTLNEATANKTFTAQTVIRTTTIAEFLANKNKDDVQYLRGYVVAAAGDHDTTGSFVLADGTGTIFSYNKFKVALGDEVIVAGVFAENGNNKFPQLGTTALLKVISSGNDVTGEVKFNLTDNDAYKAEVTADESEYHTAIAAKYAGQMVKVSGYLLTYTSGDKTYVNLYAGDANTSAQVAQLYGDATLTSEHALINHQVDIYGFVRSTGNNNPTLQVQAIVEKDAAYAIKAVPQELLTKVIIGVDGNKLDVYTNSYAWDENAEVTLYQFAKTTVIKNTKDFGEIDHIEVVIVSTYSNNLPTVKAGADKDHLVALGEYTVENYPAAVKVGQKASDNDQALNAFTFTFTPEAGAHVFEISNAGSYPFQVSAVNVYYKQFNPLKIQQIQLSHRLTSVTFLVK